MPCHTDTIDTGPEYEALLCYVCTQFAAGCGFRETLAGNVELREWWREHKRRDRDRLKEEAADEKVAKAKASALAKLTAKERNLLGFNGEVPQ